MLLYAFKFLLKKARVISEDLTTTSWTSVDCFGTLYMTKCMQSDTTLLAGCTINLQTPPLPPEPSCFRGTQLRLLDERVGVTSFETLIALSEATMDDGGGCDVISTRQRRVRKRKEWARKLDVKGKPFWFRRCGASPRFPGFAVRFKLARGAQPHKVAETTTRTKDERVQSLSDEVHASSLAFLASTKANPLVSPLGLPVSFKAPVEALVASAAANFPSKYAKFVSTTSRILQESGNKTLRLHLHRADLFHQSIQLLSEIPAHYVNALLRVSFIGESGVDAGGLHREWFVLVGRALADPAAGVFQCTNEGEQSLSLNANSEADIGSEHLIDNSVSAMLYQGIGMLAICAIFLIVWLVGCRRQQRQILENMQTPLLSGESVEHRIDAATREAEAGFTVCHGCEFENFKRFAHCSLCGEKLPADDDDASDVRASSSVGDDTSALAQLTHSQVRARRRKEWSRKLDVDGNMFWYRGCVNGVGSQFPGLVVLFSHPAVDNKDSGGVKDPQEQQQPAAADSATSAAAAAAPGGMVLGDEVVKMELVASTEADPAVFPTGSALESKERMKEVVDVLFVCHNKVDQSYFMNPNSAHDLGEDHLTYYFSTGRLIGRALLEGGHDNVESLGLDFSVTEKRGDAV
ncbi:hypothetical protein PybrP1_001263, partial [[Pythium] brassicae (nom. inval.)]